MLKCTFKTIAVLFLFSLIVSSCKKKNDQKSKTTLLTQKEWLISKFEEKLNTSAYVDDFPNWTDCDKDDKYVFNTNNIVEVNEGATKCNTSDPQIISTSAWAFTVNETKITMNGDTYTIDQLDETTLVISGSLTVGTDTYYQRVSFRH